MVINSKLLISYFYFRLLFFNSYKMSKKMSKVKKAVFPVAGSGTRFLPATKAMPKELLPIIDKPLIQYAAEEAVQAGIDTLIFITGRNKRAVEDHFDNNQELEMALRSKGKNKQADMVRNILPEGIECLFVRQPAPLGLGHAVLCAKRAVGNDPFAVLLADDFIVSEEKGVTSDLVSAYEKNSKIQLSVMEIFGSEISNYGVVQYNPIDGKVEGLVEKPEENLAPSNSASIGRYVLTAEIFDILENQTVGKGGEIQLADAINILAKENKVETVKLKGNRFDCGSVKGYLAGINFVANKLKINN